MFSDKRIFQVFETGSKVAKHTELNLTEAVFAAKLIGGEVVDGESGEVVIDVKTKEVSSTVIDFINPETLTVYTAHELGVRNEKRRALRVIRRAMYDLQSKIEQHEDLLRPDDEAMMDLEMTLQQVMMDLCISNGFDAEL